MYSVTKTAAVAAIILAAAACGGGGTTTTQGTGAGTSTTSSSHSSAAAGGGKSSSTGTGAASSSTTGSGTGGGTTVAEACAAQAHANCEEREKCSLMSFQNNLNYGSEMDCETRAQLSCAASLTANGTSQSVSHVEMCVAAFPGYACNDFYDNNPSGPCVPPNGTLATGAPCAFAGQCMSSFCKLGPFAVCGTCQPLPAVGDTCQSSGDCGRNLACVKPAQSTAQDMGTCAAYVAMGGACLTGTNPCEAGLACVGDNVAMSTMGTCQPAATSVGAACDATRKTMANCYAEKGLVCVPSMAGSMGIGTCQLITLVADSMACGPIGAMPITGFADCEAGGACIKAAPTDTTGTCKAPAADGAACDSDITIGPPCLSPAKCIPAAGAPAGTTAGTCMLPGSMTCM